MANNTTPINLRIKFVKIGNLQYISHLDLVRTMHKIIIRSKLPIWYTEGFNPKPKMVFAAPLSIGTESYVEFMDLRLDEKIDPKVAIDALNKNMTEELCVSDAYYPESKLTDLKWFAYRMRINTQGASQKLADACNEVFSRDTAFVFKKTKSGEAFVDIKPMIKDIVVTCEDGELCVKAILSADQSSFLNPENVIKYLKGECGILSSEDLMSENYSIVREAAYRGDMTPFA